MTDRLDKNGRRLLDGARIQVEKAVVLFILHPIGVQVWSFQGEFGSFLHIKCSCLVNKILSTFSTQVLLQEIEHQHLKGGNSNKRRYFRNAKQPVWYIRNQ